MIERLIPIKYFAGIIVILFLVLALDAKTVQNKKTIFPWYMSTAQRMSLYQKVEMISSSLNQGQLAGLWITPAVAHAFLSFNIDREKISPDIAEERFRTLRPHDQHLILIQVRSIPPGSSGVNMTTRLITKRENAGIVGNIQKAPFDLPMANSKSNLVRGFIVSFPKFNSLGDAYIDNLNEEVVIEINFSGQSVIFREKPKKFASKLEDL